MQTKTDKKTQNVFKLYITLVVRKLLAYSPISMNVDIYLMNFQNEEM